MTGLAAGRLISLSPCVIRDMNSAKPRSLRLRKFNSRMAESFRLHGLRPNAGKPRDSSLVPDISARSCAKAVTAVLRGSKPRLQSVEPLLDFQGWGSVASSRARSQQGHSIQVETASEFRYRLRSELACRFTRIGPISRIGHSGSRPTESNRFDMRMHNLRHWRKYLISMGCLIASR